VIGGISIGKQSLFNCGVEGFRATCSKDGLLSWSRKVKLREQLLGNTSSEVSFGKLHRLWVPGESVRNRDVRALLRDKV